MDRAWQDDAHSNSARPTRGRSWRARRLLHETIAAQGRSLDPTGSGARGARDRRRVSAQWKTLRTTIFSSAHISGKNHRATGEGAAEFRGTATKSLQNFGAPGSGLEIPEWFGRRLRKRSTGFDGSDGRRAVVGTT